MKKAIDGRLGMLYVGAFLFRFDRFDLRPQCLRANHFQDTAHR